MATQIPVKSKQGTLTREVSRPLSLFEEMERWAENMMPGRWLRPMQFERAFWEGALPQIDMIDRDAEIVIRAAVPGFSKEDIEISATADTVTIRGHMRKESKSEEEGEYYRREIQYEDFLRTVHLPCSVDDAKAKATIKEGMLELQLPKTEGSRPHTVKVEEA